MVNQNQVQVTVKISRLHYEGVIYKKNDVFLCDKQRAAKFDSLSVTITQTKTQSSTETKEKIPTPKQSMKTVTEKLSKKTKSSETMVVVNDSPKETPAYTITYPNETPTNTT